MPLFSVNTASNTAQLNNTSNENEQITFTDLYLNISKGRSNRIYQDFAKKVADGHKLHDVIDRFFMANYNQKNTMKDFIKAIDKYVHTELTKQGSLGASSAAIIKDAKIGTQPTTAKTLKEETGQTGQANLTKLTMRHDIYMNRCFNSIESHVKNIVFTRISQHSEIDKEKAKVLNSFRFEKEVPLEIAAGKKKDNDSLAVIVEGHARITAYAILNFAQCPVTFTDGGGATAHDRGMIEDSCSDSYSYSFTYV